MYFFVNERVAEQGSGIEHAQVQRGLLFRKNQVSFKIVTRTYTQTGHRDILAWGVNDAELINLFDYYAQTEYVPEHPVHAEDVDWGGRTPAVLEADTNKPDTTLVWEDNDKQKFMGRIHTDPKHDNIVTFTEVFEHFGNLYKVDFYDTRGFVSKTQYVDPDGTPNTNVYLDLDGRPVIEEFLRKKPLRPSEINLRKRKFFEAEGQRKANAKLNGEDFKAGKFETPKDEAIITGYRLVKPNGLTYVLDSFDELTKEFLNDLNNDFFSEKTPNVFISDRSSGASDGMINMAQPAYKVLHLHNLHASDTRDVMTTDANNNYEYDLMNINRFNAVVSATNKQRRDVNKRYKSAAKGFTIPVGVVPQAIRDLDRVPMADRDPHSVLMIVRRAPDKRINAVTEALMIANREHPGLNAHLDVYGYFDGSNNNQTNRDLLKLFEEFKLKQPTMLDDHDQPTDDITKVRRIESDVVTLHNYVTDRDELYRIHRQHQVYALASIMEGFNISMMEAMANGEPAISTDVNYGPNDLVVHGKNGYLTRWAPQGEESLFVKEMADRFYEVFSSDKTLQDLSDQAYELSSRYYEENVWDAWKQLINDANKQWPELYRQHFDLPRYGVAYKGEMGTQFQLGQRANEITWRGPKSVKYFKRMKQLEAQL